MRAVTIRLVPMALVCALAGPAAVEAKAVAVDGWEEARVLPPEGAVVESYHNAGYRLMRQGDEVRIDVKIPPLESRIPFRLPDAPDPEDSVARVARSITSGSVTQYDAVSALLGWVARNISYELDRSASQEAADVLGRRAGYCTGVARLSVALLRSAGLTAREVAGYVVGTGDGGPSGYHRWIEVHYDDVGWVFSDPLHSHHWVPATYLRLSSEELALDRGLEALLIERDGAIAPVDEYPGAPPGIRARRNHDRQFAAALRIQIRGESAGRAVLVGHGERQQHALVDGGTTFVGLRPGPYQLWIHLPGRDVLRTPVEVPNQQRKALLLTVPGPGGGGALHGRAPGD